MAYMDCQAYSALYQADLQNYVLLQSHADLSLGAGRTRWQCKTTATRKASDKPVYLIQIKLHLCQHSSKLKLIYTNKKPCSW